MTYNISKNITFLRENSNLKQIELAERIGITRQSLSNYENGKRNPDLYTIISLAKFFDVALDDLIFNNLSRCDGNYNKFSDVNSIILDSLKLRKESLEGQLNNSKKSVKFLVNELYKLKDTVKALENNLLSLNDFINFLDNNLLDINETMKHIENTNLSLPGNLNTLN